MSRSSTVTFTNHLQIATFIVCVPGEALYSCISVFQADGQFRPEFGFMSGLAAHDRTNMRLMQTDNPVINAPRMIVQHRSLLIVKGSDQDQLF